MQVTVSGISYNTEITENNVRNHEAFSKIRGQGKSNIININLKIYMHFTHSLT